MIDYHDALSALMAAWIVTVVAITLFVAALAMASVWDSTVYFLALRDGLERGPAVALGFGVLSEPARV